MNPDLAADIEKVGKVKGVLESAKVWLAGEAARKQAAIDAALALGATAEQLAPLTANVNETSALSDEIAAAIASPGASG